MTSNVEDNENSIKTVGDYDFSCFQPTRILNNNTRGKTVAVVGKFTNISSTEQAVVILEKTAFTEPQLLGDDETVFQLVSALSKEFVNDIYGNFIAQLAPKVNTVKATVIFPATDKHIQKYSNQNLYIVQETFQLFKDITEPYLDQGQFSLEWVWNILDHKQETERIVHEDPDDLDGFVLLPDLKWDGKTKETLYLIAIIRRKGIRSLRDLTSDHLPLLRNIRDASVAVIEEKYGIQRSQLRIYVHYQPSFYHFHVHFTYLKHDAPGIYCERSHLLDSVISNIELVADYYQKATLSFTVRESDKLFEKYNEIITGDKDSSQPSKKIRLE